MTSEQPHLVLTSNQRLARYTTYTQEQQYRQEKQAWVTPVIYALPQWLHMLYQQLLFLKPGTPLLLNELQTTLIWQKLLIEQNEELIADHWQIIQKLQQAWDFMQRWQIPIQEFTLYDQTDHQWFIQHFQNMEIHCQQQNLITLSQLPHLIVQNIDDLLPLPFANIECVGFDELTPSDIALFDILQTKNYPIRFTSTEQPAKAVKAYAYNDENEEIYQMATWAFKQYQEGATNIACVCPQLMQNREKIQQIFTEIFTPEQLFGQPSLKTPFAITGGEPLSQQATISIVLSILRTGFYHFDFADLEKLLTTPYWQGGISEQSPRALLAAKLREHLFSRVNLFETQLYVQKATDCPMLQTLFNHLINFGQQIKQKRRLNEWIDLITQLLSQLGWPGERCLNSDEYQQVEKFQLVLQSLASINAWLDAISYREFITQLQQSLYTTIYQIQTNDHAPVKIVGLLEGAGQQFDAVWMMGLTNESWPAQPSPNPFIPVAIQVKYQLPHCSAEKELNFSQKMQQRYLNACQTLIFSWAKQQQNMEQTPSTLIKPYVQPSVSFYHTTAMQLPLLETWHEPTIPVTELNYTADSSLLKKQVECPFQAFAHYRLKAKPLEKIYFLTNKKRRGILLHQVLQDFWQKYNSNADLPQSVDELHQVLREQTEMTVINFYRKTKSLHQKAFIQLEIVRIYQLLCQWISLELQRSDFTIYAIEKNHQVSIGNLTLRLRVDRIDQLANGDLIIIDYKTGTVSEKNWINDQFTEPQLPLYCLLFKEKIAGLVFAILKPNAMNFRGLTTVSAQLPSMEKQQDCGEQIKQLLLAQGQTISAQVSSKQLQPEILQQLQTIWQKKIEMIASDFMSGIHQLNPLNTQVCEYCQRQSLCRLYELTEGIHHAGA